MNIRPSLILALIAAISLATTYAAAQQGRGQGNRAGGESPNDPSYLLASESVQKELALTDDQKKQLEKIWDDEQNGAREFFRGFIGIVKDLDEETPDAEPVPQKTGYSIGG